MSDTDTHDQTAEPITDGSTTTPGRRTSKSHSTRTTPSWRSATRWSPSTTTAGNHVNLVTHGDLGHPEEFLYDAIEREYGLDPEYVEQCGCGGHVTRVQVA